MGFLGTAASAAVGVAGGIMAANALKGMFGGGNETHAADHSQQQNAQKSSYDEDEEEGEDYSDSADLREASYDDSGSDFGGGGDFSDA
jgi:hypothetical protein